jgi:hypothetical protein
MVGLVGSVAYASIPGPGGVINAYMKTGASDADFLNFSFTTLAILGYGDLVGRMLAVLEALMGQLYPVTVVALLLGTLGRGWRNLGRDRGRRVRRR